MGRRFSICYCRVSRRLRGPPHLGRARSRSLRIILAVEGAFVGSWLPFCALRAVFHLASLGALPLPCRLLLALRWGLTVATCLAFVNSCANPLIYLLLDRSFRAQLPTPVFLPGESQGWGSLVGCRCASSWPSRALSWAPGCPSAPCAPCFSL